MGANTVSGLLPERAPARPADLTSETSVLNCPAATAVWTMFCWPSRWSRGEAVAMPAAARGRRCRRARLRWACVSWWCSFPVWPLTGRFDGQAAWKGPGRMRGGAGLARPRRRCDGVLVAAVEDGAPDRQRHRGERGEQGDERADDEQSGGCSSPITRCRGRGLPRARIEGTQSPTKMPWSSLPENQRETERRNETAAATRNIDRAVVSRDRAEPRGSAMVLASTFLMVSSASCCAGFVQRRYRYDQRLSRVRPDCTVGW